PPLRGEGRRRRSVRQRAREVRRIAKPFTRALRTSRRPAKTKSIELLVACLNITLVVLNGQSFRLDLIEHHAGIRRERIWRRPMIRRPEMRSKKRLREVKEHFLNFDTDRDERRLPRRDTLSQQPWVARNRRPSVGAQCLLASGDDEQQA